MIAIVYGTRPEFLKIYPLILEAKNRQINFITINTGQHTSMLSEMEDIFNFKPDYSLECQSSDFSNSNLLAKLIDSIADVVKNKNVTKLIAQGDTFTVLASSIVAFLEKRKFYHIEAGLRTDDINFPFPEEYNRRVVSLTADMNFAPTELASDNLKNDKISSEKIIVTGNTIIDLLKIVLVNEKISLEYGNDIFITAHRRENISDNMLSICEAIKELATENPNLIFNWSLHPNPNTREFIFKAFDCIPSNIKFIEPLNYIEAVKLMAKSRMIISDSGGIQEEAPTLQKKVLVLRNETERPEVLTSGCGVLVGSDKIKIKSEFYLELNKKSSNNFINPFGNGNAAKLIFDTIS